MFEVRHACVFVCAENSVNRTSSFDMRHVLDLSFIGVLHYSEKFLLNAFKGGMPAAALPCFCMNYRLCRKNI